MLPIVTVATATIIPFNLHNPRLVLVGRSSKHNGKLVLPGGKIERRSNGTFEDGLECATREVFEETGVIVHGVVKVGEATDRKRTPRFVTVAELANACVSPTFAELQYNVVLDGGVRLEAHYGIPDEIFIGGYHQFLLPEEELELSDIQEVDITSVSEDDFSAAHDVLLLWYRWMLETGASSFPSAALRNFRLEREVLTQYFLSGNSSLLDLLL